jgi:hypothetical protein
LNELRDSEEFEAWEAVLLMDNCLRHISDDVVAVLTHARVRIITFAPHTTHIFQMLDVVLFSALKKHANFGRLFLEPIDLVKNDAPNYSYNVTHPIILEIVSHKIDFNTDIS